ncbi:MAG: DinB family protein [Ignavibacteriaceae bacterium]
MKSYFINLFKYHAWANQMVIEGISSAGINEGIILKILSHLLQAEKTWLQRLKSENYDNKFWIDLSLQNCNKLANNNGMQISAYLSSLSEKDFETKIKYTNSKGIEYTNTINEILTHLSHHSSYHRGQIAREMRRLGKDPVYTDYIAYLR